MAITFTKQKPVPRIKRNPPTTEEGWQKLFDGVAESYEEQEKYDKEQQARLQNNLLRPFI